MRTFTRNAVALALAGAVTASAATPTLASDWRPWAAAGAGFVAGAAIANAAHANRVYYGPGGHYGYAYAPAYDSYAYAPSYEVSPTVTYDAPVYYAPRFYGSSGCNKHGDTLRTGYTAGC